MLIMVSIFARNGFLTDNSSTKEAIQKISNKIESIQSEAFTNPSSPSATTDDQNPLIQEQKHFSATLTQMHECLKMKGRVPILSVPGIDNVIRSLPEALGEATIQDRWLNWHMHHQSGGERRIRLVIDPDGLGEPGGELRYFAVDKEGLPVPLKLEGIQTHNPTYEVINTLLKEGEVFYKEKAATAVFQNGKRIQYIEKNDSLSEFEISLGDGIFKCTEILKPNENCQCIN